MQGSFSEKAYRPVYYSDLEMSEVKQAPQKELLSDREYFECPSHPLLSKPLFDWYYDTVFLEEYLKSKDFQAAEAQSVLNNHFDFQPAKDQAFQKLFTRQELNEFLAENCYKDRAKWLQSIQILTKRSTIPQLLELFSLWRNNKADKEGIAKQKARVIQKQKTLQMMNTAEEDLITQKLSLQNLCNINRPFLSAGKTNARTSKHNVCIYRKKSKKQIASKIAMQEKLKASQMKLSDLNESHTRTQQRLAFETINFFRVYSRTRLYYLEKGLKTSYKPLLKYTLAAWIHSVNYKNEKLKCQAMLTESMKKWRVSVVFTALKDYSTRKTRKAVYSSKLSKLFALRKLAKLLKYWKWCVLDAEASHGLKALAYKFNSERLVLKKLFEWKIETKIIKGLRNHIKALAQGEEDNFSKAKVVVQETQNLFSALQTLNEGIKPLQKHVLKLHKGSKSLSFQYPTKLSSLKAWLQDSKVYGQHMSLLELRRKKITTQRVVKTQKQTPSKLEIHAAYWQQQLKYN